MIMQPPPLYHPYCDTDLRRQFVIKCCWSEETARGTLPALAILPTPMLIA